MFLARNLNPMERVEYDPHRRRSRASDAFGVLGEPYNQQVWVMENTGESEVRRAEPLARKALLQQLVGPHLLLVVEVARERPSSQADKNTYQFLTDLNLDEL